MYAALDIYSDITYDAVGDVAYKEGKEPTMSSKRVVFTFDDRSLESLDQIKAEGRFSSLAEAVREALRVSRALQAQGKEGFTQVKVRNPKSGEERTLVIPELVRKGD